MTSDSTCVVNGALAPSVRAFAGGTTTCQSPVACGVTVNAATPSGPVTTACTSAHAPFFAPAGRNWMRAWAPGRGAPWEATVAVTGMGVPNTTVGTPVAATSVLAGASDCA